MCELRIVVEIARALHGRGGHARVGEHRRDFMRIPIGAPGGDGGVDARPVGLATFVRLVLGPIGALQADDIAQRDPLLGRRARDGDVTLRPTAGVDTVRRVGHRVVTGWLGHSPVRDVVEHERGDEVDSGLALREIDELPFAAAPALVQGGDDGEQSEPGVDEVRERTVCAARCAIGPAGNAVQPAQGGPLVAEPRVASLRARLTAKARADHDEVLAVGVERTPVEAEASHGSRREALDHHVRPPGQCARNLAPLLGGEVERNAELRGVVVRVELRRVDVRDAVLERGPDPQPVQAMLGLHADHRRAVVRQALCNQWADPEP